MRTTNLSTVISVFAFGILLLGLHSTPIAAQDASLETAKARIKMLGGKLEVGKDGGGDTISVSLNETQVTDADLETYIKGLTNLRTLLLYRSTKVSDTGLLSLKDSTKLRELNLVGTKVTDAGLKHLAGMKELEQLAIDDMPITDAGLAEIKALPKLRELGLYHTKVSDDGLRHLKGLRHLQVLNLNNSARFSCTVDS